MRDIVTGLGDVHGLTLTLGAGTIVLLVLLRRFAPRVPAPLVAMVAGVVVVAACLPRRRRPARGVDTWLVGMVQDEHDMFERYGAAAELQSFPSLAHAVSAYLSTHPDLEAD